MEESEEEKYDELKLRAEMEDIYTNNYIYLVPQSKDKNKISREKSILLNN